MGFKKRRAKIKNAARPSRRKSWRTSPRRRVRPSEWLANVATSARPSVCTSPRPARRRAGRRKGWRVRPDGRAGERRRVAGASVPTEGLANVATSPRTSQGWRTSPRPGRRRAGRRKGWRTSPRRRVRPDGRAGERPARRREFTYTSPPYRPFPPVVPPLALRALRSHSMLSST